MVNLLADYHNTKSILPLYKALVNDTSRASLSILQQPVYY
jgi:hypothetical protein